jgi:hypothetical protein
VSRLRDILRPEAELRASLTHQDPEWGPDDDHLDILCDDIDANTRALAVQLAFWEGCRWDTESAPRLERVERPGVPDQMCWRLVGGGPWEDGAVVWFAATVEGCRPHDIHVPGIDSIFGVPEACRALWSALETREDGGQP